MDNKIRFIWIVILIMLLGVLPLSIRKEYSVADNPFYAAFIRRTIEERMAEREAEAEPECPPYCTKDFLLGKINYRKDTTLFIKVDKQHTWNTVYLLKETYEAYKKMYEAARKDGVKLMVISGCRTFNDQQCIWVNKWNSEEYLAIADEKERARKILQYVAVPGTSRHHWGTEIDFNSARLVYYESGPGKRLYEWLRKNAADYGFYQPYTPMGEGRTTGYHEEMWHWTYLPLSGIFLKEYLRQVQPEDLSGFDGANVLRKMDIMEDWVLGVNQTCK